MTISSGPAALCLFIIFNVACTSDLRIFGPCMSFGIGGLSALSSWNNSQIYSIHLYLILCFSTIIVPSLDFIHQEDEQELLPVISLIFLYIDVVSFPWPVCFLYTGCPTRSLLLLCTSFVHISLSSVLYVWLYLSVTFCLFFISSRMSGVIHLFLLFFFLLRITSLVVFYKCFPG